MNFYIKAHGHTKTIKCKELFISLQLYFDLHTHLISRSFRCFWKLLCLFKLKKKIITANALACRPTMQTLHELKTFSYSSSRMTSHKPKNVKCIPRGVQVDWAVKVQMNPYLADKYMFTLQKHLRFVTK